MRIRSAGVTAGRVIRESRNAASSIPEPGTGYDGCRDQSRARNAQRGQVEREATHFRPSRTVHHGERRLAFQTRNNEREILR